MKIIQSLMGRRQFLVAAGATSTSALVGKRFAGILDMGIKPGIAMASDKAGVEGVYKNKYSHLLSPLKIENVVLKNRMMQADSYPFCMQGPENFPAEQVINWYSSVAKNGCAIVMVFKGQDPTTGGKAEQAQGPQGPSGEQAQTPGGANAQMSELPPLGDEDDEGMVAETQRIPIWDKNDLRVQNYFAQLTDAIHFYGSKAAVGLQANVDRSYSISKVSFQANPGASKMSYGQDGKEIPAEKIQEMIEDVVKQAKFYKGLGFDMVHFHMAYRRSLFANALSPVLNVRTDKYGGSLENRARLHLEMFQAIKKACGQNFLVGVHLSGKEMGEGGYTPQDVGEYAKIWEGALDILVVRGETDNVSHATPYNFNYTNNPILNYAQTIKETGTKMIVAPNGGFQDLDKNEEYIATGKCDMISMARAWWVDPEYGKKAYEGRGEDVVPCVRCNDCHGGPGAPVTICTVNPVYVHAHRLNRMVDAPTVSRKVAVIGGGPAGMKAAMTAAERGHKVTLYEKNDFLGGQLKHTDYPSFKWTYRDFKDYLVRQVKKMGIDVHLSTKATPEMIKKKRYDVVIAALGAEPIIPEIPGAKDSKVIAPIFAYNNKALGKNIVVIGGEQIGTETGMHLAEIGHNVTVLTPKKRLASDANGIYLSSERWGDMPIFKNFSYVTEATVKGISEGYVTYIDAKGSEKSLQADNVVIYAGRKPRQEEALKFYSSAERFFIIGDCSSESDIVKIRQGNLRISIRTAFAAASQI